MNKIIFCLFSALLMTIAEAQSSPVFTVTWTAPTQYVDGTTIAAAITYQLYVGPSGAEVKYGTPVTSPPYVVANPTPKVGATTCVQVTSIVNGVESAKPTEVCGTIPFPQPNAPSTTTITIK